MKTNSVLHSNQDKALFFSPFCCHSGSNQLLCYNRMHKDHLNTTEMHQQ